MNEQDAESGLSVRVLGRLTVLRHGAVIGPGANLVKPRLLFGALAVHSDEILSKDVMVDRLWERPPSSARNLVEKYVSMWRKVLDDGRLETLGSGYRLHLAAGESDLRQTEHLLAKGRSAIRVSDNLGATKLFGAALDLWDPAFEDAASESLPDSDLQRLTELRVTIVEEWATAALAGGKPEQPHLELLIDAHRRHPLRERLGELVMWALVQQGRQQDAIACYERMRRALGDELGQDPGPSLQAMYLRVLRQDPLLMGALHSSDRLDNLPPRNLRFVGRAKELDEIEQAFAQVPGPSARAVAAWGLVGAGKTALALEYAYRHSDAYQCVWWVDATTTAAAAAGLESLAARLGCPLPVNREPTLHQLWDRLRTLRSVLLVFDNAGSATDLVDHLPPSGCEVLITSMNPEWRRLAEPVAVGVMSAADSIDMLRHRIGAQDTEAEAALVAILGRLPLAMGQAAAYIDQTGMTVKEYLPLFRRRRSQLLQRGVPDDHRNTIDTTWQLARAELSAAHPAGMQLLAMCSFFGPEKIPQDLIVAVPHLLPDELRHAVSDELDFEEVIRQVRRYSLMGRDHHLLQMHCLVQNVIADSLSAVDREEWRRVAAAALVSSAPDEVGTLFDRPRWEMLVPHIRVVAGEWPAALHADPPFVTLVQSASAYLSTRGDFADALELMEHAQKLIERNADAVDHVSVGRGLTQLGAVLEQNGRLAEALVAQERALTILQDKAAPDDPWTARALSGLSSVLTCHFGVSLWKLEDLAGAEERFVRVLAIITTAWGKDSVIVARTLAGLGQVRQDLGDLSGGRDCLETALRIMRSTYGEDHPDVGHCYDKLAYLLALSGDTERSRKCYARAARILSAAYHPDHVWVAWSLSNLAMLDYSTGDLDGALRQQLRADGMFRAADSDGVATQISAWRLARIHLAAGRTAQAVDLLRPALRSARSILGDGHADVGAMQQDLRSAVESLPMTQGIVAVEDADRSRTEGGDLRQPRHPHSSGMASW